MDDLISREAAIDAICKACSISDDYVECVERRPGSTFCDEIVALRKVPSAQPERKTGKWVGVKEYCDHIAEREGKGHRFIPSGMNNCVYCNQCWESNDRRTTYCPNCGARMEE